MSDLFGIVYCPLSHDHSPCLERGCAWWCNDDDQKEGGYCVVHRIGGALDEIHEELGYANYLKGEETK